MSSAMQDLDRLLARAEEVLAANPGLLAQAERALDGSAYLLVVEENRKASSERTRARDEARAGRAQERAARAGAAPVGSAWLR